MNSPSEPPTTPRTGAPPRTPGRTFRNRVRTGVWTTLAGLLIFTLGAKPGWFGLDRSPTVGFIQISVFLFGLAIICLGGLAGMSALWNSMPRTIVSDIGMRLVGTGYLISFVTGMADILGFGSQPLPASPFFGPVEATGVVVGEVVIAIGFLLHIPYHSFALKE